MNRFQHSDNITLNRRDLFNVLQDMIYLNQKQVLSGIYNLEPMKILCGQGGAGIPGAPSFRVARGDGAITVSPGVAIKDEDNMIVLASTHSIPISGVSNGIYYVYVTYAQEKSLTGRELTMPAKARINTEHLYTMLADSAAVGISLVSGGAPVDSIILGTVIIDSGVIPVSSLMTIVRDMNSNEEGGASAINGVLPAWASYYSGAIPMQINDEYIILNGSKEIQQRGAYNTLVGYHSAGSAAVIPSIVDMRQYSTMSLLSAGAVDRALSIGMLPVGGGYRRVATRRVNRIRSTPDISLGQNPVTWTNRARSIGAISDRVKNMYYSIQSSAIDAENSRAMIQDIRYRMLGASEEEVAGLSVELRAAQRDLVSANNSYQDMLSSIGKSEVSKYMKSVPNAFTLAVDIADAYAIQDGIVQYEAEVKRVSASSVSDINSISSTERAYSWRMHPIGYDITGDPRYAEQDIHGIKRIYVPINIGERVSIRVRGIDANGICSGYGNTITYDFTSFNDSEYLAYQNIYDMIFPDVLANAATLREYTQYMKNMWDEMSSMNDIVKKYQSEIDSMHSEIEQLKRDWFSIMPLVPLIPGLQAAAMITAPATPTTGQGS